MKKVLFKNGNKTIVMKVKKVNNDGSVVLIDCTILDKKEIIRVIDEEEV
jgi:hypothetical protein